MLAGDEDSERRDPIPWQEQLVKNICRITMPASPTRSNFLQIRRYLLTHRSKSTQLPKGQVKAPAP
jgi:hypothetical protein